MMAVVLVACLCFPSSLRRCPLPGRLSRDWSLLQIASQYYPAMTTPQIRDSLKYTRICKYWSSNRCKLGKECNFAHSELELRNQPDLVSTRLCFQFSSKGRCKNGENCKFAHGRSELRTVPKAAKRSEMEPMKIQIGKLCLSTTSPEASPRKIMQFRAPPGLAPPPPGLPPPGLSHLAVMEMECSTASPSTAVSEPSEPASPRSP